MSSIKTEKVISENDRFSAKVQCHYKFLKRLSCRLVRCIRYGLQLVQL